MVVSIPAPQSQFPHSNFADAGADADDSWAVGEIGETASFIVDRIAEDRKFLADLNDDSFDFQQWYQEQLDDFTADQDNVAYDNDTDRSDDLDDFTEQLNELSTEFASSQGEDYANFVRDIIGEGIDHLHDQSQELLGRLQETANDLNDLEEQEYDLYIQMSKISCVHTTNYNVVPILPSTTDLDLNPSNYDPSAASTPVSAFSGTAWPGKLLDNPNDPSNSANAGKYIFLFGPFTDDGTNGGFILKKSSCSLDQLREELNEAYKKYNASTTSGTQTKQRKKIKSLQKKYRDYVRKWQKLQHTFIDVQQKEDHEKDEYDEYEFLLSAAQDLQELGMQGSDALVLPDSRIPTATV